VFSVPEKDDLLPATKSIVRADLRIGGWILEPVEGDPNKTRC